ncbi:hypothetical protein CAPTEDRAFT_186644 [Capitella teleta]|uniref:glucose-6-phosphatase n=1 Tax=Capitella teleta TaxID=283909 RepID=R7TY87_CAPTE|nr:hypothetical protein CAPTEDRAFT_186644 [Capitella teleta]|eukprot:ELT95925.1 hypothetical protein CAPTEDRAFT_186644 [Capitella teleta]
MDELHLKGIELILWTQRIFQDHSDVMLVLSHLGDPRNAFLVFFPLMYFCNYSAGIKTLWVAAVTEWINAILKWFLFGHRPYWWIHETSLYTDGQRPDLQQFPLTCETGPGSPSGHAMVSSAVLATMIIHHQSMKHSKRCTNILLWACFVIVMFLIGLSRCFISTHFPHQVVAGTLSGITIALICDRLPLLTASFGWYLVVSVTFLLSGPVLYFAVETFGADPMWSLHSALQWCANRKWVHLDTTLFFSMTRDSAALLARVLEEVKIPSQDPVLFYTMAFLKFFSLPIFVMTVIPSFLALIFSKNDKQS